jgi:type I restriction enzyme S subunit
MENLKKGFKQTEIGILPEDWEVKTFGEVIVLIGGGTFKSRDNQTSGVRWLKIANVGLNKILWDDESYLPVDFIHLYKNFVLEKGDYVIALTRPILNRKLKIAQLRKQDVPSLLNQRVGKIVVYNVNSEYIYHLFQKDDIITSLLESMAGTDPPNLSNRGVYEIKIPLPPTLSEQTAIAAALSEVDELIQTLEKQIQKKKAVKQGAMHVLLSPKEGWEEVCFNDILDYEQPQKYLVNSEILKSGKTPVLTANKSFLLGYTEEDFGICTETPVIIFDDFTTLNKKVTFPFKIKSSAIKFLKPKKDKCDLDFIYAMMSMVDFSIGDHKRYYLSEYRFLKIFIPNLSEQQSIASILSDMDAEIEALTAKKEKYKGIKQAMMQELLTGKTRLVAT